MRLKLKHIYFCSLIAMGGLAITSCEDFLDRSPISQVTPEKYFSTVDQVANYLNNYYNDYLDDSRNYKLYHQQAWNSGMQRNDANTDNLLADDSSLDYFAGNWQVGSGKSIQAPLNRIRTWNYLLEQVLPKEKEGSIQGSVEDLKHYIGEAYFFRAMAYYKALVKYGDYPIVDKVLPDQEEILLEYSTRAPRNEVARQILKDLDEAINRMHDQGFQNNQRINKQVAQLYKSRVALFEATFEKYHRGTGRVPGDESWPGAKMSYNSGKTFNIDGEIDFFLTEAMNAAAAGTTLLFGVPNIISEQKQTQDLTGYRPRKAHTYDYAQTKGDELLGTNACVVFRSAEANLNYMEACYEKTGSLDAKAQKYWKALRTRAGVDDDYAKTIAATDLSKENDLAVYSGSKMVDVTLYNIRRERRCEFIGEGMRWDDLKRWRSWDQLLTKPYIIEGINFWDAAYKDHKDIKDDGTLDANVSPKSDSKYLRPLRRTSINNELYDGLTWRKAFYLDPIGIEDMSLTATNPEDINTTQLYQNPYWPMTAGKALE
ncbi:RagB/SusD family nutrient uptake outer membrane protein [Bacteroides fragilis]|uniref:Membrane protein n=1 Tax=Bacteroides fragilis TaxID=817 RepID=A0A853PW13_BACFG|nr:RagB/SusD family nutrient uptake outer membrane protein [Bacteroides fragilis]OCR34163.1 membrane protein [Bacteroides fragilis]